MELYQTSSKTITPVLLEYTDVHEFSREQRTRNGKKTKMPLFGKVCEVKFSKDRRTMMHQEDFDTPYTEDDFLKAKFYVTGQFPSKRAEPFSNPRRENTSIFLQVSILY